MDEQQVFDFLDNLSEGGRRAFQRIQLKAYELAYFECPDRCECVHCHAQEGCNLVVDEAFDIHLFRCEDSLLRDIECLSKDFGLEEDDA